MADEEKVTSKEEKEPSGEEEKEDVITFGEEDPPTEEDSSVIKGFRKRHKAHVAEITDLKKRLATTTDKPVEIGPKPTLDSCDMQSDEYEKQLNAWHEKKNEISQKQAEEKAEVNKQNDAWNQKLNVHREKASALKVQDYEDKEDVVREMFDETQQGLIIDGATNSAVVVYAFGKYPETAKALAAITNPVKFVAEMSRLEAKMSITKRTPGTSPETVPKGSGGTLPAGESELEKLREEADRTGNYTEVIAYRKRQREKNK